VGEAGGLGWGRTLCQGGVLALELRAVRSCWTGDRERAMGSTEGFGRSDWMLIYSEVWAA